MSLLNLVFISKRPHACSPFCGHRRVLFFSSLSMFLFLIYLIVCSDESGFGNFDLVSLIWVCLFYFIFILFCASFIVFKRNCRTAHSVSAGKKIRDSFAKDVFFWDCFIDSYFMKRDDFGGNSYSTRIEYPYFFVCFAWSRRRSVICIL